MGDQDALRLSLRSALGGTGIALNGLAVLIGLFLLVQHRIDSRDPKLADAAQRDEDREFS